MEKPVRSGFGFGMGLGLAGVVIAGIVSTAVVVVTKKIEKAADKAAKEPVDD